MKLRPGAAAVAVGFVTLALLGGGAVRSSTLNTSGPHGSTHSAVPAPVASRTPTPHSSPTKPETTKPETTKPQTKKPQTTKPRSSTTPHPDALMSVKVIPPKRTPTPTPPATSRSTPSRSTPKAKPKPKPSPRSTTPVSCTVTVAGVKVTVASTERTRTVVNGSGGTRATISMVSRTDLNGCTFTTVFTDRSGRIGYGGFANGRTRKQGTGTTPTGTYSVTEAFGLHGNPGTALSYRRAGANDWWILDFKSAPRSIWNSFYHYNGKGYRPKAKSTDDTESEQLTSFPGQYNYSAVLNFNRPGDPAGMNSTRGGGIFLHVNGSGATAGCVSTTQTNMVKFLTTVRPGDRVTIVA